MFDPSTQHRRSIRLRGYDYAQVGFYFVTVVTQGRELLFGDVENGEVLFSDAGEMIRRWWFELPCKFPRVRLDSFVVMPNHLHGILEVCGTEVKTPAKSLTHQSDRVALSHIVQWFKTMTTNEHLRLIKHHGWRRSEGKLWQRNYYEHIIRHGRALDRIREYIRDNPLRWTYDPENPFGAQKTDAQWQQIIENDRRSPTKTGGAHAQVRPYKP